MADSTLTQALATFARETSPHDVPPVAMHAARRTMLDFCGVALAGSKHPATLSLRRTLLLNSEGISSIIGTSERTSPFEAAQINGFAAHIFDWDDTILPARAHFGATLLPAIFAESARHEWTLREGLVALAIGFEIAARLSAALYPSIHDNRWHTTSVIGPIGVAAALGRLLGRSATQIAHSMGLAANGASGLMSSFGTPAKALNVGRASAWGLLSAHLGAEMETHPDTLEAGGFIRCFANGSKTGDVMAELGRSWAIERNGFKPYPCGFVAHPAIDALLELRMAASDRALGHIALHVAPVAIELMGRQAPANELEAKFSLSYVAAIAWLEGNVSPNAFAEDVVINPRVRDISQRLSITPQASIGQEQARAEAIFSDGSRHAVEISAARGSTGRPLSDEDLVAKFLTAAGEAGVSTREYLADLILRGNDVPLSAVTHSLNVGNV